MRTGDEIRKKYEEGGSSFSLEVEWLALATDFLIVVKSVADCYLNEYRFKPLDEKDR